MRGWSGLRRDVGDGMGKGLYVLEVLCGVLERWLFYGFFEF